MPESLSGIAESHIVTELSGEDKARMGRVLAGLTEKPLDQGTLDRNLRATVESPASQLLVRRAVDGGAIVSTVTGSVVPLLPEGFIGMVDNLAVFPGGPEDDEPDFRRHGLATSMLVDARARFAEQGTDPVYLTSRHEQAVADGLYGKVGYVGLRDVEVLSLDRPKPRTTTPHGGRSFPGELDVIDRVNDTLLHQMQEFLQIGLASDMAAIEAILQLAADRQRPDIKAVAVFDEAGISAAGIAALTRLPTGPKGWISVFGDQRPASAVVDDLTGWLGRGKALSANMFLPLGDDSEEISAPFLRAGYKPRETQVYGYYHNQAKRDAVLKRQILHAAMEGATLDSFAWSSLSNGIGNLELGTFTGPDGTKVYAVRDTSALDAGVPFYTEAEWRAVLDGARDGQFDKI